MTSLDYNLFNFSLDPNPLNTVFFTKDKKQWHIQANLCLLQSSLSSLTTHSNAAFLMGSSLRQMSNYSDESTHLEYTEPVNTGAVIHRVLNLCIILPQIHFLCTEKSVYKIPVFPR